MRELLERYVWVWCWLLLPIGYQLCCWFSDLCAHVHKAWRQHG